MKMNGTELINTGKEPVNFHGDRSWRAVYYNPSSDSYHVRSKDGEFTQVYRITMGFTTIKPINIVYDALPKRIKETMCKIAYDIDRVVNNDSKYDKYVHKLEGYIRCLNDLDLIKSGDVYTLEDYVISNYIELMDKIYKM